jgi:hypothetical protein
MIKRALSNHWHHIAVALMALGVGLHFWYSTQEDAMHAEAQQQQEASKKAQAQRDFQTMSLAQAIAQCRTVWPGMENTIPLALAWHSLALEWYTLSGVDTQSMRHFSCDGAQVSVGRRYRRVLRERVPASTGEPRNILRDINLFDRYTALSNPGVIRVETAVDPLDPVNGGVFERLWMSSGAVHQQRADTAVLPALFAARPAGVPAGDVPALEPLPNANNWLLKPAEALAVVRKHMPPETRISEIDIRAGTIKVTIIGPVKNFENKPPAPFGDATFDEYGIRDASWWYPRESGSCTTGRPLEQLAGLLAQAPNLNNPAVWNVWFGCSRDQAGDWVLRVPRRRR